MVRTRSRHLRAVVALGAALAVMVGGPAVAIDLPPSPGGPPATPPTSGSDGPGSSLKQGTIRNGSASCYLVAGPNYLGARCSDVTGSGQPPATIRQILDGDPLPDCWDAALSHRERAGLDLVDGQEWFWHWHKCLEGIDPETLEVDAPQVVVTTRLAPYRYDPGPGDYEPVYLTPNQGRLVARYENKDGIVPAPRMGMSPSVLPLVNQDVSFYHFGDDATTIDVPEVGMQMRARMVETIVLPEGRGGPSLSCAGAGYRAGEGEDRTDHPQGCWHRYDRSSRAEPDDVFPGEFHNRWVVETRFQGGSWQYFHEFVKGSYVDVDVNEVQALVVP